MLSMFLVGLLKIGFGFLVGVVGVLLGARLFNRLIGRRAPDAEVGRGNVAVAILKGSGLIALGILCRNVVESSFSALDFLRLSQDAFWIILGRVALYSLLHTAVALTVGACVLAAGTVLFDYLTGGVKEIEQIWSGNVAPAIVVGAILIVLSLMTAPGLQTALDGLLPIPELPEGVLIPPH